MEELKNISDFDYSRVTTPARIALYDSPRIAPRIVSVEPAETTQFIQNLATRINDLARTQGGEIPYTVILEVTENFIHAQFKEIVVSILDGGNTIRFTDQGPGIADVERAVQPGYTTAIEPMKTYIRGVGSGLPIVSDWMNVEHGRISIDSNIGMGSAVTISLVPQDMPESAADDLIVISAKLKDSERAILRQFATKETLGITEIKDLTGISPSSVSLHLNTLEDFELVERTPDRKRKITPRGKQLLDLLS